VVEADQDQAPDRKSEPEREAGGKRQPRCRPDSIDRQRLEAFRGALRFVAFIGSRRFAVTGA